MSWAHRLRPGDVILFGRGRTPRVVLHVTDHRVPRPTPHVRRYVTLTIQRCSWTTRPTTLYLAHELERMARPSRLPRQSLRTPIRKALLASLDATDARDCPVHCHEVVGLP